MKQLRAKVKELRGELESFSSGVSARIQPLRGEVDGLAGKVKAAVGDLRATVESTQDISQSINALDAELAKLEP